jgi:hypothetical protein
MRMRARMLARIHPHIDTGGSTTYICTQMHICRVEVVRSVRKSTFKQRQAQHQWPTTATGLQSVEAQQHPCRISGAPLVFVSVVRSKINSMAS